MGLVRLTRFFGGCFLLVSLCACHKQIPSSDKDAPRFYSQTGKSLREADFTPLLREADFILVGENHLSTCDHAVQTRIVSLTGRQRSDCVVGMEMLFPGQQPALNDFFQGKIGLKDLEEALDWKKNWGHPFFLYRSVFAAVHAANLRLFPLNLPRKQIRRLAAGKSRADFPFVPVCSQQKERLRKIFAVHQAMLGHKVDENRFLKTQAMLDSVMAWKASQAAQQGSILLLAGSGHVENGWGIEYRLRQLCPSARIIRFTPVRTMAELQQAQEDNFDLDTTTIFFLCPAGLSPHKTEN